MRSQKAWICLRTPIKNIDDQVMPPVFACPAISLWSNLCLHRLSRVEIPTSKCVRIQNIRQGPSSLESCAGLILGIARYSYHISQTRCKKNRLLDSRYRQRGQHKALDAAKQSLQKMWYPGQGQITASVGPKWIFLVAGLAHTDMYMYVNINICICICK